jgi:hypothetical protein
MLGGGDCVVASTELFRSSDGGATWTYLYSTDLQSTELVLPPSTYAAGRFFAAGGNVLQVTDNGGRSFHAYGPSSGYSTPAPAWLGAQVVTSDTGLSFIDSSQVPHLVALFGPGEAAAGPPLLLPAAGGFTALQLVQNQLVASPDTLLRCTTGGCATQSQVPLTGTVQILPSPDFDRDHTLVAVGGGVAVSRDGGNSFQLVSTAPVFDAIAVSGPIGVRLLAVDPSHSSVSDPEMVYSDDLGRTWHGATFDQPLSGTVFAHSPRLLAPGRLIASAADARHPGMHLFVCSSDGTTWSACGA